MKSYFFRLKGTILQSFLLYGLYSLTLSLFPLISQQFFDHYDRGWAYLWRLFAVFALLVLINLLAEYGNRVWEWKLSQKLNLLLKQDLFERFISQDNQTFARQEPVDYASIIQNNVPVVDEDYLSASIDLAKSLVKLTIFCLSMTYVLNWQLTSLILVLSLVTALLPNLTQNKLAKLRKLDLDQKKRYNLKLLDFLSGHRYVSKRNIATFSQQHYQALAKREDRHFRFGRFRVLSDMIYSIGTQNMYLLVFLLSGYFLVSGQLTLGAASATLLYVTDLIGAIGDTLSCVNVLHSAKEVVDEMSEELAHPVLEADQAPLPEFDQLTIDQLSYNKDQLQVRASQLNFVRGMSAIIGPSGAGKSTLLQLINGDLIAHEDQIRLNGKLALPDQRREVMFTIRQEEHLFDTDFTGNVTLFGQEPLNQMALDLLAV